MSKKLLVVVDMQKDFVNGSLGFPKAETLVEGIKEKVNKYIANGDHVVFTYDTHFTDYLKTREGRNLPIEHCILGTEGHKLVDELEEIANDIKNKRVHICHKENKFGYDVNKILVKMLNSDEVAEIELVGVVTNICVISNAVTFQTAFPEASLTVDASLCASFNDDLHEKALDVMEGLQVTVINR